MDNKFSLPITHLKRDMIRHCSRFLPALWYGSWEQHTICFRGERSSGVILRSQAAIGVLFAGVRGGGQGWRSDTSLM